MSDENWLGHKSQAIVTVGPASTSTEWEVEIGNHPTTQTVVFEQTTDWKNWKPIKGQRLLGPGPRLGSIHTNAVAGGPAWFRGTCSPGVIGFRARCVRYDDTPIELTLKSKDQTGGTSVAKTLLIGEQEVIFVIEEEKTLEDLLSEL